MDSHDLRDPTTAQSVPTIAMADKSQKITTRLASTLEFRSLESTQRSCPDKWEFQVGPCIGIAAADQVWMARYLLGRVAKKHGISVSFAPKLFKDWNGASNHTNFSTKTMRDNWDCIEPMMKNMAPKHGLNLSLYGNNDIRLTWHHKTAYPRVFSHGVGNRACFKVINDF